MVGKNIAQLSHEYNHEILMPTSGELNLLDSESLQSYIDTNNLDMVIHAAGIVGGIQAKTT